ncbi:MAG: undecaprenyl diphosphate synthase family protein, partial [Thermoleophilia bacterium]|nr:undecaprenyl diphosphate synthase family protein [Thermoleophilia bacterium]
AEDVAAGRIAPGEVGEAALNDRLDTAGLPDPDLVIRTSGETRISNYLLWQSAYAEYEFTDTLWPDFTPQEFAGILERYALRERRFGGALTA